MKIYQNTKNEEFLKAPWHKLGQYPKTDGRFASCIRILDPFTLQTLHILEFENGETCFSVFISQEIHYA